MRAAFTLPSGNTVRTSTIRDYVLILESNSGAWIGKRSDKTGTIESTARRLRRSDGSLRCYLGDTASGEIRDLP